MDRSLPRLAALLCLVLPALAQAAWNAANDEANRQRMMNSMRASAAASDRRASESLERSRAAHERSYGNKPASPMSGAARDQSASAYRPAAAPRAAGSIVSTEEFTVYVRETESQTIARVTREAQAGKVQSQFNLARIHYTGYGVARDDATARRWFAAAAAQGHLPAQSQYGAMLYNGQGGAPDQAAGRDLVRKSAAAGDPAGQALAGFFTILEQNDKPGADLREAVGMLESAAADGQLVAQATLGRLVYLMGVGAPRDLVRAVHYLRLARDDPGALSDLARLTMGGMGGIAKDEAGAVQMFAKAAEMGNHEAEGLYAFSLIDGRYVPKDLAAAVRYARLSAQGGDPDGQLIYAKLLYFGQGLPQDLVESARWFRKAAAQGKQEAIDAMNEPDLKQADNAL